MDPVKTVVLAHDEFERRLRLVTDEQWSWPTPCAGWTVRDLGNHATATACAYVRMLEGCSADEAVKVISSDVVGDDPLASASPT